MADTVDAANVEMPFLRLPDEPYTRRQRWMCPLCKAESEYPGHSLEECVAKLAERLDRIENNADPRSRG